MLFAEAALLPMRHAERPGGASGAAAVSGSRWCWLRCALPCSCIPADKLSFKVDYSY